MYYKERLEGSLRTGDRWMIYDQDGTLICIVTTEKGADALLSHLNR